MSIGGNNNGVNKITKIFSVDRENKGKEGKGFSNRRTQRDAELFKERPRRRPDRLGGEPNEVPALGRTRCRRGGDAGIDLGSS